MAYCTISDVSALNASRMAYSSSTKPTATQVQAFIDFIAADLDTHLAYQQVAVPVTTPANFVAYLKNLNALGAAAYAEAAQFPEFDGTAGSTTQAMRWWKLYREGIFDISYKHGGVDPGAAVAATAVLARTYLTDNPDNDPTTDGFTDGQQPVMSMGKIF